MAVTPYWLGTEFQAAGRPFRLFPTAYLYSDYGPGVGFVYSEATVVQSYTKAGGGAREVERRAATFPGSSWENVLVGDWSGKVYVLPTALRPVNKLRLFVDLGETVVIVTAWSASTGVPGTDPNPLIDKDLLIQVVADNLRPYPE